MQVAVGLRKKPPVIPDPFLELLQERGFVHERQYKEKVEASGSAVLDLSSLERSESLKRCREAMRAGQPAIAQGALGDNGWDGAPDLLLKVGKPSRLGPWSYDVYDTKLAQETRGTTILQLSLYSDLLRAVQGVDPEFFYVVTPLETEKYRVSDYAAFYRLVRRRLLEAAKQDPAALEKANYPEPVDYCDLCRWSVQCDRHRRDDDHLSLVAGISRLQRRELEAKGISTLEQLGELGLPLPFKPTRGSRESLGKAQEQARIQLDGRRKDLPVYELLPFEEGRGLARLPEPSVGDVFLDLEGDHFAREGGREYLFGITVVETDGKTSHRRLWAHSDAEEKAAFETAMDMILSLWAANPGMHIYHYAPYEPAAFKRLMARHATHAAELDRMLRAGLFVDLCAAVKQGVRASVESYSIKDLERFYGFKRQTLLNKAGGARRAVEFALEVGDLAAITEEVRTLVEEYNREDCVSAHELRGWLESLRAGLEKTGVAVHRPPLGDGKAPKKVEKRGAEVQKAMDALLAGVPADRAGRSADQQARWLLAHMLEFHRREDNVAWWEFFRLCGLTDEDELLAERAVVTGLAFVKRTPPTGRACCPTDQYRFPPQEFEARAGDELKTQDGVKLGTIADINRAARWINVTKTTARMDDHPRVAFVHSRVPLEPLPSALLRLADDVIKNGLDDPSRSSAARELLLGRPPRLNRGPFEHRADEDVVQFARRTVLDLDRSVLALQGPPGAGKTFAGARMIVECVRRGLKVGVSAVSHKVIKKLLEDAVKAGREEGVSFRCVHKDEQNTPIGPGIDEVAKSEAALAAVRDGSAHVVSGTAWLWARADAADALDMLFVDEAGQASLANVLAMSLAAKSIVLLGDPQQLEQPQRGTHPEGVDASTLEHLLAGRKTIPDDLGIFLGRTWRLSPEICKLTSELFYEGRLESRPQLAQQTLSGAPPYEGAGLWFETVEHDGNTNSSPEEVKIVEAIVAKLIREGSRWTNEKGETRQMTQADVLVVAPFNAQVNLLQDALESRGVRVGTVDRFQGQEAAVVIYSMATSRPEDAPRGMEFLYDLNRLNVATSRGRCACILVASARLLEPECKTPRQMRLANAMCRYVELARDESGFSKRFVVSYVPRSQPTTGFEARQP